MTTAADPARREEQFRVLYEAVYVDLLRFVRRRVHPTHAEDVVADAMLVVWRRFDDVPTDLSAARAWVFGVARKNILNAHRRGSKEEAVAVRLREVTPPLSAECDFADALLDRILVSAAWPKLSALHQEALALAVIDCLTATEAAIVLGISPVAFRLRLSRARRSLRHHIQSLPECVACQRVGTGWGWFLPGSWDRLDCQSWDHPARLAEAGRGSSLTRRVTSFGTEVSGNGIQGGQRG